MNNHNKIVFLVLALFLTVLHGDKSVAPESRKNVAELRSLNIEDMEVPDSPLLLLDRAHVKKKKTVTKQAVNATTPVPAAASSTTEEAPSRSCQCALGVCRCCTGPVLDLFNQKACMKVTYHPGDFAFDVAMSWNDRILYENSLTGKNPRPVCISPPRLNNLKVCAKFYNVFFPGRNFHFCLAMTGQFRKLELFNMAFNCLRMGADGVAMMRPEDNAGMIIPNPQGGVDAVIDQGDDIEDYDENVVKSLLDLFDKK